MSPSTILTKNLRPASTAALAAAQTRAEFAKALGAILLLRIDDGDDGEVAQVLAASLSSTTVPLAPAFAFRTVASAASRHATGGRPSVTAYPDWLRDHIYFAVPLRKRADSGMSFTTRISVGRAMNNDIVLRHASISKFHAWLEADEGDNFYVSDAGSRNGTFANGARLAAKSQTEVAIGTEVRFAAIVATISRAETLWEALHSDGNLA